MLRMQRLVSDARRNVRLYSRIKDRKSPLKGSRPSVPHGTSLIFFKSKNLKFGLFDIFTFFFIKRLKKPRVFKTHFDSRGSNVLYAKMRRRLSARPCVMRYIGARETMTSQVDDVSGMCDGGATTSTMTAMVRWLSAVVT